MRRVNRDRRGVAAVEFAIIAPVLILLALATSDLVQFIRSQLRLDETAVQLGQLVSQCDSISTGDTQQFWNYAQQIIGSLGQVTGDPKKTPGAVIISAVYSQNGANKLAWQVQTGNPNQSSSVGGVVGGRQTSPKASRCPPTKLCLSPRCTCHCRLGCSARASSAMS
jgi:Flp pilus assembly protein TadG